MDRLPSQSSYLFIFIFLLPFSLYSQQGVSFLENTFKEMEVNFGINISYNSDLLKDSRIGKVSLSGLTLEETFVKLLRNSPWEFEILSDQFVVIKAANPSFYNAYQQRICGKIRDATTSEPLPFANVQLVKTTDGCSSDIDGQFQLNAPLVSNDSIEISYLGYQRIRVAASYFSKSGHCPTIQLSAETNELASVIVEENKFKPALFLANKRNGERVLNLQKLDLLGGQVEKDVFQVLQLYPGISSQEESASDINIRGGARGQNLVLYDGIILYHFGHFFGKVSATNPHFSDKISLFSEGIDAQYGGRVAGVIDIKSKADIPDNPDFTFAINTLATDLSLHLPLFKNKGHLLAAYRRSYTHEFKTPYFQKVFDQIFQNTEISRHQYLQQVDSISEPYTILTPLTSFSDLNIKLAWVPTKKDEVSISFIDIKDDLLYTYTDVGYYQQADSLHKNNTGVNVSARHHWNDKGYLNFDFALSKLNSRYGYAANLLDTIIETRIGNSNRIKDYSFKLSNFWKGDDKDLHAGIQYNMIDEAHKDYIIAPWSNPDTIMADTAIGHTIAAFVDFHYDIASKAHFNFGLRASHFNLTHGFYLEPRFHSNLELGNNWQFKISSGIYYQTINEIIELDDLNTNTSLWILARDSDIEERDLFFSVVKNEQFSFGFEKNFLHWTLTIGAYQKALTGITSRSLRLGEEFAYESGNMSARGLECSAQKQNDRQFSMLSYTLGEAIYDFKYLEYNIPATYDYRHHFSWLQGFYLNHFTLSSTLTWHTGGPYSQGAFRQNNGDEFPDNISYWIEFERNNGLRLPNYLRWDISLSWQFGHKNFNGQLQLAALNILNRKNILNRQFVLDYNNPDEDGVPPIIEEVKLGILFSPNIGLELEF